MIEPLPPSISFSVHEIFSQEAKAFAFERKCQDEIWNQLASGLLDALEELRTVSKGTFDFHISPANHEMIATNLPRESGPFLEYPSLHNGLVLSLERNDQNTFDVKLIMGEERKKEQFDRLSDLVSFFSGRIISALYLTQSANSITKARRPRRPKTGVLHL